MHTPQQILAEVEALLQEAKNSSAGQDWETAQQAIEAALKLDENNPPAYDAMAECLEARGEAGQAEAWRERAKLVRKQAWQRQVEAEARGHHDLLGEPSRHEIP
jgi:Tfp pilus assembly protein PilF